MASFVELNSSAESGCSVCMMLRDAVSAFEDATHVRDIGAWVEDQESPKRIGWRSGLRLHFRMLGGDDVGETLHVYCTDSKFFCATRASLTSAHVTSRARSQAMAFLTDWRSHLLKLFFARMLGWSPEMAGALLAETFYRNLW
jgi:hypothetical protein